MQTYTDAPPIYHRACALSVMGALLTRQSHRCVLHRGVEGTWPTLWMVLIGDSGRSRKSTAIGMAEAVLKRVDGDLRGADDMSPEGLLNQLRTKQSNNGDPSTLLIFSEFINLLLQFRRSYSQVLRSMLLKLYDVDPCLKRQLKKEVFEVNYGRVSILGGIPAEILATYGTAEDWVGGFFNRCIFIPGVKEREQRDLPQVSPAIYDNLAKGLTDAMLIWQQTQEQNEFPMFKLSEAAMKVGRELKDCDKEPHLDSMLSRSMVHFSKVAAIEQVDEDPTALVVGKAAAERAFEFIAYWQKHLPHLLETCFTHSREDFEADKLPKKIIRYLERAGGSATDEQVLSNCSMNSRAFDEAVTTLIRCGRLRVVETETGGRELHLLTPSPPSQRA